MTLRDASRADRTPRSSSSASAAAVELGHEGCREVMRDGFTVMPAGSQNRNSSEGLLASGATGDEAARFARAVCERSRQLV